MLLQMALFHSFLWLNNIRVCVCLWLNNIPVCVCVYTISSLSVHLSMVASMLINSAAMNTGVYVSF